MKKLFFAFVVVLFTTLAASNELKAQKASNNFLMDAAIVSAGAVSTDANANEIDKAAVNPKAVKHFEKKFKAADAKWMVLKDGFMAQYKHDDIIERVFYNPNGNLAGTLKGYFSDNMPAEVRSAIKFSYAGYAITYVDEASVESVPGITAYIIHLQGINDLKVVRICDGEMDILFDSKKNVKNPARF